MSKSKSQRQGINDSFEIFHETVDKNSLPIKHIKYDAFKYTPDEDPPLPMISPFAAAVLFLVGTILSAVAIGCFLWVLVELIYIIGYKAF